MLLIKVLTLSMGLKMGKSCLCNHGQSAVRESHGKAAGREEQLHPLSDLPAEDVLGGNSQAKESGHGDPWEATAWEEEGG